MPDRWRKSCEFDQFRDYLRINTIGPEAADIPAPAEKLSQRIAKGIIENGGCWSIPIGARLLCAWLCCRIKGHCCVLVGSRMR